MSLEKPHFKMPHIYCVNCAQEEEDKIPRMRLTFDDEITHTQCYRCESCGTGIHVDTDWFDKEAA